MRSYGTTGNGEINKDDYNDYLDEIKPVEDDPADRDYIPVEPEIEEVPFDPLAYARDTVDETIVNSDYFNQRLAEEGIDVNDRSNPDYLKIMYEITNTYLDQNQDYFVENFGEETFHAIRLFGTAPYALRVYANEVANEETGRSKTGNGRTVIVDFNHTLFNLVESNRKRGVVDLAKQVERFVTQFDPSSKGFAHNAILDYSYGVRTESGFVQAYEYRKNPANKLRHGNNDEDKRGIDFVVQLLEKPEMMVDIKTSLDGVASKAGEHKPTESEPYSKTDDGQYVYCPQFKEENYMNGTFELDLQTKIRAKNTILEHLHKMSVL